MKASILIYCAGLLTLTSCEKATIVLVCEPINSAGEKVAISVEEDKSTAAMLDPVTLKKSFDFADVTVTPTMITFVKPNDPKHKFWLLDRGTGRLKRNDPSAEFYCSDKKRV